MILTPPTHSRKRRGRARLHPLRALPLLFGVMLVSCASEEVAVSPTATILETVSAEVSRPTVMGPKPEPSPVQYRLFCHVACGHPDAITNAVVCPPEDVQEVQQRAPADVRLPPRHERHFLCSYQLPPDYWGVCDGRSGTEESYQCP